MSEWKPVSSFVKFTIKGITPKYVNSSSIIVLNQKCIRNNKIDYSYAQYTDDSNSNKIDNDKFVQKGDILVNSTGAGTAGRSAFVTNISKNSRVIVDSHILILRCNSYYEAQCLSYALFYFEKKLMSFMTGSSGQSELDKVVLLSIKIQLPTDLKTQQKIASVLSNLDEKIALNQRINAELEAMAKTIYDYWFAQFEFPNAEGKPYKSSGGAMVWSEELKREIPEGWNVGKLGDIVEVINESINPFDFPDRLFKHYSIPAFDSTGSYKIEHGKEIKSNKYVVDANSILVSKLNPWFKRVIYASDENDLISSTEFVAWRTDNVFMKNFLYLLAQNESFVSYCVKSAAGTSNSHKRVNPSVMMQYPLAYNLEVIKTFGLMINPILKMCFHQSKQTQQLTTLRDWLLPMLMNGQVRVE